MKNLLLIAIFSILYTSIYSQCLDCKYKDGEVWVVLSESTTVNEKGKLTIDDPELNSLLVDYNAAPLKLVFPSTKRDYLKRVYEIQFEGETSIFVDHLNLINKGYFTEILKRPIEKK